MMQKQLRQDEAMEKVGDDGQRLVMEEQPDEPRANVGEVGATRQAQGKGSHGDASERQDEPRAKDGEAGAARQAQGKGSHGNASERQDKPRAKDGDAGAMRQAQGIEGGWCKSNQVIPGQMWKG